MMRTILRTHAEYNPYPAILIMTTTYPIPGFGGRAIRLSGVYDQPSSMKSSRCSQLSNINKSSAPSYHRTSADVKAAFAEVGKTCRPLNPAAYATNRRARLASPAKKIKTDHHDRSYAQSDSLWSSVYYCFHGE